MLQHRPPSNTNLALDLGVKSDPIEYRYSFEWLFRLMAEEGVHRLQLGTFFELYHLPDDWFRRLRAAAEEHGIVIAGVFTSHRELGGLFQLDAEWHEAARWGLRRLVAVAGILGVECAGHNAGAVLRDRMETKTDGLRRHVEFMKELLIEAGENGVPCLTLEPMSCLAEPPTLPDEIRAVGEELSAWSREHPGAAAFGYCVDVSHGYVDASGRVRYTAFDQMEAALPWLRELHLKNTDARLESTFGFGLDEVPRGTVDPGSVREFLLQNAGAIPVTRLTGYLEIGGPKTGRDYSDPRLEEQLRQSLRYLRNMFVEGGIDSTPPQTSPSDPMLCPSVMCFDLTCAERTVHALERLGAHTLHFDVMDGHFTPNLPLGFEIMKQLRRITDLPFDVHLMVDRPEFFVERSLEAGANWISVHAEACTHLDRVLAMIRDGGAKAGVALNPATPLSAIEFVLPRLDFVLVMTVNPGFAGQKLTPGGIEKIRRCREWLDAHGSPDVRLQADGNVSLENIPRMVAAGADMLVLGTSSVFRQGRPLEENWTQTLAAVQEGRKRRNNL